MKSTSTVALIISMWVLSSWGWAVTQAAEPSLRSSFEEWCQQKASLSAEARKTVEVLLEEAGTNDCELAANNVSSRTELYLSGNEITDLRPLAGLTNLRGLILDSNQIIDLTPLAGLTNLKHLTLSGNPITDLRPLAGLTNLCLSVLKPCLIGRLFMIQPHKI